MSISWLFNVTNDIYYSDLTDNHVLEYRKFPLTDIFQTCRVNHLYFFKKNIFI